MNNKKSKPIKLVLGTAQFGLPYGVTRTDDHVDDTTLRHLLEQTEKSGIAMLDTSPAYGTSETRLGQFNAARSFALQTKTFGGQLDLTPKQLEEQFSNSLKALQTSEVESFLVHSVEQLKGTEGKSLIKFLQSLKDKGLTKRIGVSVYDAEDIDFTLELFKPDVIQLPVSIADQRLIHSGHLDRLKNLGITIQARSIFLQGLLLTNPSKLPSFFTEARSFIEDLRENFTSTEAACMAFIRDNALVDEAVFGVHTSLHLHTIISASREVIQKKQWENSGLPEKLVDPRLWK
ncbi:aldo/keto reductase [Kiloniella sp. EL199]|uniref:aldo/keto reductase n=1 Tax=Kiloniella sp. EL199 TaxID=2107581 RepID=UPI000EA2B8FB|nr:aldo/keto reductase [Kiloniella sp. EL199]